MPTEADTCRKFVVPLLQKAGWDTDPHSIAEQRYFTAGRIVSHGGTARRRPGKRADYLLRCTRDLPLAVVEAKAAYKHAADGLQQAKEYANILSLPFAYATNGTIIIEFDFLSGHESELTAYPTPAELWARFRKAEKLTDPAAAERFLTPFNLSTGKIPHYYQRIAIERVIKAILAGRRRVLVTMATGTGKTVVAFHICWKLWSSKWNSRADPTRKPRILYLADRNFLVDDPKDKTFAPFGDARHKIEGGVAVFSRELYFATYQSIARDERRPGLYKEFPRDFFDLVIVDECHRGSAKEDSNWREILQYFEPAYQLGMTATPLRDENRDTYLYFGNPVYTYSLKQGIDDGFLAPYRVHRIVTQWDAAGWRPSKDDLDRYGREIPDEVYTTADFERRVALRARTQAVARHLTDFLKKTDRFAKTIVFCVDQEHASEMRPALNNLSADLVQQYPDYVCRVTANEGDIGRGHMQRFQDVETRTPVILTTSQLLTTGLDAPTCRNVVLVRLVNSMVEFKQIIGRGTRVRDDYAKLTFNILDYTGTATRNFADPAFDGDPAFATQEEIDEYGKVKDTEVITPEEPEDTAGVFTETYPGPNAPINPRDPIPPERRKFYFDGGQVEIAAELVHELDADGKQLRVVKLTDYTAEKVRTLCTGPEDLRARWADATQRAEIIEQLAERGIDFQTVAAQAGKPDADPFDLLCHLAFNAPVLTRRQRADRMKQQQVAFFGYFAPEAQEILNDLLEKYAIDGELQFTLPDVLKVAPIWRHGNVAEIVRKFGGVDQLRNAVSQLQTLLYAS
ncbi:MAG TPA: DEAD/DEAH box helicase family protein [Candidatus Acidoferrum sp.]|jgi:type I restriction enzyme R subunit|nr:DEAD/DEAH box helicase family protein [Candidatus Acidoferrum sp.]